MKILFVTESQGWSGGAAQLLLLAKGLKAKGADVRLASPEDGEVARRAKAAGIPHIPFHPRQDYDLVSAARLARILDAERFEVLHAHHPRAHAVCVAAAYLASNRPVLVVTRRVSFPLPKNVFSRLKYRNPRIDGFVAVAEAIRQELLRGGVRAERVRTIPSGVETADFAPRPKDEALAAELGLPAGVPVIGKIGNHGEWKGQDHFLAAAAALAKRGRRAVFVLAGRDTDSEDLLAKAKELGLEPGTARFLGFRADVPRILSLLSVSVNAATKGEGISGALRESLAMGVPVCASDAGGNAELVEDGVTGRLFKAGDPEDLARVLAELLDDPAAARAQAERGRALVLERYSVDKMVERTDEYYRELAARRGGVRAECAV
ncbi:MAG TPA: glycosyltransferase [Elusimicrobiota bacterium]|nr:glycosyltransferase [Elusimicrobiota bacterium]